MSTPMILSLVYDRGTILASKRSPYDDLLIPAFDEKALSERLQKQHKLICAAVRAGRIEDLKRMTMKESASRQKEIVTQKETKLVTEIGESTQSQNNSTVSQISKNKQTNQEIPLPQLLREKLQSGNQTKEIKLDLPENIIEKRFESKAAKPQDDLIWDLPIIVLEDDELIVEAVQIVEEDLILPADAVEVITDSAKNELKSATGELKIELPKGILFNGGERKTLNILVHHGDNKQGLSGAQIMIKILGSMFRPLIFHAKTDAHGFAVVHLQIPSFKGGRASIIIKAMSEGKETEFRQTIEQG